MELEDGEEHAEGNYYAPTPGAFSHEPFHGFCCPLCSSALMRVVIRRGAVFGRIGRDLGERRGKLAKVVVDLIPADYEAFQCTECGQILSRPKESEA